MSATKAEILEMAKALPYDELWELLEELRTTLHPKPSPLTDEEFRAELQRRWQQILADPSQARPADEVIEEIRRKHRSELDRRWEEYKSGQVPMVTWDDVKAQARQQLEGHS